MMASANTDGLDGNSTPFLRSALRTARLGCDGSRISTPARHAPIARFGCPHSSARCFIRRVGGACERRRGSAAESQRRRRRRPATGGCGGGGRGARRADQRASGHCTSLDTFPVHSCTIQVGGTWPPMQGADPETACGRSPWRRWTRRINAELMLVAHPARASAIHPQRLHYVRWLLAFFDPTQCEQPKFFQRRVIQLAAVSFHAS